MKSFILIAIACFVGSFASGLIMRLFLDKKIKALKDKLADKETVIAAFKQHLNGKGD